MQRVCPSFSSVHRREAYERVVSLRKSSPSFQQCLFYHPLRLRAHQPRGNSSLSDWGSLCKLRLRLAKGWPVEYVSDEFGDVRVVRSRPRRALVHVTARHLPLAIYPLLPAITCSPTTGDSVASFHDRDPPRRTNESLVDIVFL